MWGFQQPSVLVRTSDGRNFIVEENLDYEAKDGRYFRIPTGATSDGASTPSAIWDLIPPFGRYWLPAVLHDAAYRNTLLIRNEDNFVIAALPKEQCDNLLLEAMESLGIIPELRGAIFEGVNFCGQHAFDRDRG